MRFWNQKKAHTFLVAGLNIMIKKEENFDEVAVVLKVESGHFENGENKVGNKKLDFTYQT